MATIRPVGSASDRAEGDFRPVLLVEDNPGDVLLVRRALGPQAGGFDLRPVELLETAIQELRRSTYAAVLLDLGLPDSQGLATLTRLLEAGVDVPVVVTTGFDDEDIALQAVRLGAQDYVVKGNFGEGSLRRTLRYAIERARAEESLREAAEQFHRLFEEGPVPMWILDASGLGVLAANRVAVETYGWGEDELRETSVAALLPEAERPGLLEALRSARAREGGARLSGDRPCIVLTRGGERRETQLTLCSLPFRGRPALLMVASDVTELRHLERQLFHAAKMEAIGHLASGVAHDFNNLLAVITGYAEELAAEAREHRASRAAGQILGAAENGARLVRQLFAVSRQQPLEPCALDLHALFEEMQDVLHRLIGDRVETVVRPGERVQRVLADPVHVQQVLMNLAVNARDAMPDGGTLTFETENALVDEAAAAQLAEARPGAYVRLRVSDTGTGMDPDTVQRIFEPFYTTKSASEGTGLGLATVYGVVRQNGGFVTVRSEPGRGSAFEVHLPVAADDQSI